MRPFDILIVGAGHGGAQAAILLRQLGFGGSIGMVGAEPELPYERPPLSKDYLAGEKPFERMLVRPPAFCTDREIEIVPSTRIVGVDQTARSAFAEGGQAFGLGSLIWAAGGAPRRLKCEGADLAGVHVVRSRAEVDSMRAEMEGCRRIAVIGGARIRLESVQNAHNSVRLR